MKVAGNKLRHLLDYYERELKGIYPDSEIQAMFNFSVQHYLKIPAASVKLRLNDKLNQSDLLDIYDCCKALKNNLPLQYIHGEAHFYNLTFQVDNRVLIPRPETEELVELILKENAGAESLLDIGTGSGCIPVSFKRHSQITKVWACDIDDGAIDVAKKNAEKHQCEVHFFNANVLNKNELESRINISYEIIVSNPPYIKKAEMPDLAPNVINHEPHLALFVEGEDAIVFYRRIADICLNSLKPGGRLYFELNPFTAEEVKKYAENSGLFSTVTLIKDLSGNDRFLKAVKTT